MYVAALYMVPSYCYMAALYGLGNYITTVDNNQFYISFIVRNSDLG